MTEEALFQEVLDKSKGRLSENGWLTLAEAATKRRLSPPLCWDGTSGQQAKAFLTALIFLDEECIITRMELAQRYVNLRVLTLAVRAKNPKMHINDGTVLAAVIARGLAPEPDLYELSFMPWPIFTEPREPSQEDLYGLFQTAGKEAYQQANHLLSSVASPEEKMKLYLDCRRPLLQALLEPPDIRRIQHTIVVEQGDGTDTTMDRRRGGLLELLDKHGLCPHDIDKLAPFLRMAAAGGHDCAITYLLRRDPSLKPVDPSNPAGHIQTALQVALEQGQENAYALLLGWEPPDNPTALVPNLAGPTLASRPTPPLSMANVFAAAVRRAMARRGAGTKRIPFIGPYAAATLTPQASRVKLSEDSQGQQGTVFTGEFGKASVVIKTLELVYETLGQWEAAVQQMASENPDAIEEAVMLCLLHDEKQLGLGRMALLGLCVETTQSHSSTPSTPSPPPPKKWQVVLVSAKEPATLNTILDNKTDQYMLQHPYMAIGIALSVARAIERLHEDSFYHGDAKPSNILVRLNKVSPSVDLVTDVTLCDFGRARDWRSDLTDGSAYFTAAPDDEISQASDVFSVGMLLWSLLSRQAYPWPELVAAKKYWEIAERLENGMRPEMPPNDGARWTAERRELIETCWHQDPGQRPVIQDVVKMLRLEVGENFRLDQPWEKVPLPEDMDPYVKDFLSGALDDLFETVPTDKSEP